MPRYVTGTRRSRKIRPAGTLGPVKTPEQRLTDLEIRYTEQEDLVHKLDETVRAQQDELDRLSSILRRALDKVKDLEAATPDNRTLADDVPPHY